MDDYTDDFAAEPGEMPEGAFGPAGDADEEKQTTEQRKRLVAEIIADIKADKKHHDKAFRRMRRDMQIAMWGADKDWIAGGNYVANIAGRHVKQKTAALYAKNPRVIARRREQMDYAVWDENPMSLQLAMKTMLEGQQAVQMAQAAPPSFDPMTGMPRQAEPQMPNGYEEAMALLQDAQQGFQRRQMYDKIGKTTELLTAYFMNEQQPLDFKRGMKATVRRANTTGVGYVELGFQREMGPRPGLSDQLADARARLDHLRSIAEQLMEGEYDPDAPEREELALSIQSLVNEPEIVLREGLIFDYPQSTKVIPDKCTKSLDGFIGARHMAVEYIYTPEEIHEIFGVDLKEGYTSYSANSGSSREIGAYDFDDEDYEWSPADAKKGGMVCVWKYYDKPTGLVYYVADGYSDFLREPAPPDVFVETFWPIFALTFNAVESEDELFPPSDVSLIRDMQKEHNRSRQGLREHRDAARPRWVFANGSFADEEDPLLLKNLKPFEALGLNMGPQAKIADLLQVVPVPGVDPNLYETGPIFSDTQVVVGSQEAQFGGVSKATATESAIAANSTTSSDGAAIDDLDAFLTAVARACGQILQREMTEDIVKKIVGPGAVWPEMTLAEIAGEIVLEIEAGSTGKPNQAVEIQNMERLLPLIIQLPGIQPYWLAKQVLKRLDDRLDLTEGLAEGLPSIMAQNGMAQPAPSDPTKDPNAQGAQGKNNAPAPPGGSGGSMAHFGSNQVPGRI